MDSIKNIIEKRINESIQLKSQLMDKFYINKIHDISKVIIKCYENGGKVLFCGNGGSAADAQHLSAELSGRYYFDRPPLNAEALHVNSSYLTAVANDYSFDEIYARLVRAFASEIDILIGLSTSGNSKNVVKAMQTAKEMNMTTIGLTGQSGGRMKENCDIIIEIPSIDTPRIQECHMLIGHLICEVTEATLFATK